MKPNASPSIRAHLKKKKPEPYSIPSSKISVQKESIQGENFMSLGGKSLEQKQSPGDIASSNGRKKKKKQNDRIYTVDLQANTITSN